MINILQKNFSLVRLSPKVYRILDLISSRISHEEGHEASGFSLVTLVTQSLPFLR